MTRRLLFIAAVVGLLAAPLSQSWAQEATLEVLTYINGATISIDGEEVATTPMIEWVDVEPGTHIVRVEKRGFVPWEEEVEFEPGDEVFLEIELIPFGGVVTVVTREPGAIVLIDGDEVGVTPYEDEVPIGEHVFIVRRDRHEDWVTTEVIAAGEEYLFEAELIPLPDTGTVTIVRETTPFYRQWWFWTAAAVVVGGGVAAGVLLSEDEEAEPVNILISLP